jgi:hypothetical protein
MAEPRAPAASGPGRQNADSSTPVASGSSRKIVIRRLLILWIAVAVVVWNGVYDMRMHDTVRGYLLETARADAHIGGGVDMRDYLRRGRVDAIAFSTAWAGGILLAGLATMRALRRTH